MLTKELSVPCLEWGERGGGKGTEGREGKKCVIKGEGRDVAGVEKIS